MQCNWSGGDFTLGSKTVTFRGSGSNNDAIFRLASADGVTTWMTSFSAENGAEALGFQVDPLTEDVYAAGYLDGNAQLGTGLDQVTATAPSSVYSAAFYKITAAGVPGFVKTLSATDAGSSAVSTRFQALVLDPASQSIWCTGYYSPGNITFAGQTLDVYNVGDNTVLVTRYGLNGTALAATNYYSEGPAYSGAGCVWNACMHAVPSPRIWSHK